MGDPGMKKHRYPAELSPAWNPEFLLCCGGDIQAQSLSSRNPIPPPRQLLPGLSCPGLGPTAEPPQKAHGHPHELTPMKGGGGLCSLHSELGQREGLSSEAEKQNDPRLGGGGTRAGGGNRVGTSEPQAPPVSHGAVVTTQGSHGASGCHQGGTWELLP